MRGVSFDGIRRAALCAALGAVACESSAPASTETAPRPEASEWTGTRAAPAHAIAAQPQALPKDAWVLHIGDSFVEASLSQDLRPRFRAAGAGYVVDATTATYTTTWAYDPGLEDWLARRPALVLVTLGANEVDMPVPEEHAAPVERLAREIAASGASCVWITPPTWKKDTGILQVIHDHCAPCLYLDSDAVLGGLARDERQGDGIHPNRKGGARWANAVWSWLSDHRDASRPGWALAPYERRGP